MTEPEREKALDRCKASLFMHSNAAFYGSLLCALQVVWNADIPNLILAMKIWKPFSAIFAIVVFAGIYLYFKFWIFARHSISL